MSLASLEYLYKVSNHLNECAQDEIRKNGFNGYYVGVAAATHTLNELLEHEIEIAKGNVLEPKPIADIIRNWRKDINE